MILGFLSKYCQTFALLCPLFFLLVVWPSVFIWFSLSLSHDLFLPYPLFSQDQVNQYLSNQLIIQDGVGSSVEDLNQAHKRQRREKC
jgi:hypothetical protein